MPFRLRVPFVGRPQGQAGQTQQTDIPGREPGSLLPGGQWLGSLAGVVAG